MNQHHDTHPITRRIRQKVHEDLASASRHAERDEDQATLVTIGARVETSLSRIDAHLRGGRIAPAPPIRLSLQAPARAPVDRVVRLGVFPVNGNPLHWGHLIAALDAIGLRRLDLVVMIIQGRDLRKRVSVVTERHRHAMARDVLGVLAPLVAYSDIGRGTAFVGEDNVFRLLRLNPRQRIEAHYLVGSDHYRRLDDRGAPDTLTRLERHLAATEYGLDPRMHELKVLVLERDRRLVPVETSLDVAFVPVAFDASSTAVREGRPLLAPYRVQRYCHRHAGYAEHIASTRVLTGAMKPR